MKHEKGQMNVLTVKGMDADGLLPVFGFFFEAALFLQPGWFEGGWHTTLIS